MKQLITIIITFISLGCVSLLWDIHWIYINPFRKIIVALLFLLVLFFGYRFYDAFAKENSRN